jgi:YcxB-like protein
MQDDAMNDASEFLLRYEVTDELLRLARARFRQRYFAWPFYVALVLSVPVLDVLWMIDDFHILAAAVSGIFGTVFALALTVKLIQHRRRHEFRAKYPDRQTVVTLGETGFSQVSPWGTVNLPWSTFRNTWWFSDVVLLFFGQIQFIPLPLSAFPPGCADFLRRKVPEKQRFFPGA